MRCGWDSRAPAAADTARAAHAARDTGQIKSIPAKAKRPSETEAAFLLREFSRRTANFLR
jgi:hypothetical protein